MQTTETTLHFEYFVKLPERLEPEYLAPERAGVRRQGGSVGVRVGVSELTENT